MDLPKNGNGTNNWVEYRRLVLHELKIARIERKEIKDVQTEIRLDVKGIKVKAGIYGAAAGVLVSSAVGAGFAFAFGLWG